MSYKSTRIFLKQQKKSGKSQLLILDDNLTVCEIALTVAKAKAAGLIAKYEPYKYNMRLESQNLKRDGFDIAPELEGFKEYCFFELKRSRKIKKRPKQLKMFGVKELELDLIFE